MARIQKRKNPCYCINLRRAANMVSQLYDGYLEPIGISVNQYSLLSNIGRLEVCSVSDLASYVGLERTTLVRTLKPLIERGLIVDNAGAGQRNRALQLTQVGQEAVEQGGPLWEKAQAHIVEKIGQEKVAELEEILTLLGD